MRQILSKLLPNAVKYTPSGSVRGDSRVRDGSTEFRANAWIAVTVTDPGPEIASDKCETIFRNSRLDPETPHGVGEGLAVSRRIASLLEVTSRSRVTLAADRPSRSGYRGEDLR